MAVPEQIIPLSKNKVWLLIFISIVFVAIGFWMLSLDAAALSHYPAKYRNPVFVHGVSYVSIVFFGLGIFVGIKKLFDDKPCLLYTSRCV